MAGVGTGGRGGGIQIGKGTCDKGWSIWQEEG